MALLVLLLLSGINVKLLGFPLSCILWVQCMRCVIFNQLRWFQQYIQYIIRFPFLVHQLQIRIQLCEHSDVVHKSANVWNRLKISSPQKNDSTKIRTPLRSNKENNFSQSLARINSLIKTAWSKVFFPRRQPRNFYSVSLVARRRQHFQVRFFLVAPLPSKEAFQCTRIHSLLVNGVVTASSHAL